MPMITESRNIILLVPISMFMIMAASSRTESNIRYQEKSWSLIKILFRKE